MNGKLFFTLDTLVFFCITYVTLYVRHGGITWSSFCHQLGAFIPIFLFVSFVLWLFSFYDIKLLRKRVIAYKRLCIAFIITLLGSASVIYFVSALFSIPTPRRILIVILLLYFSYIYALRRNYFKLDFAKINVLMFGQSPTLNALENEMKSSRGYCIKFHEDFPQPDKKYNFKNIDYVVVGSRLFHIYPAAWDAIATRFIAKGAVVDTDFNVYEKLLRRVSRESIEDQIWLLRGIGNRNDNAMYNMLKRTFDLTMSLLLLPFLIPLSGLIWLFIRFVDGYPPLFIQKRIGYLEKPIYVYKFRTIRPGGTEKNVTRMGKILRRFRLDEIPQLINVLKGEISFVGPRPLWKNDHEFLCKHIPNHALRTIVKPGITGWAQLNFKAPPAYCHFRNEHAGLDPNVFDAAFTRFSYDVWYIKNRSVFLDFEILFKTALRMFIKDTKIER